MHCENNGKIRKFLVKRDDRLLNERFSSQNNKINCSRVKILKRQWTVRSKTNFSTKSSGLNFFYNY